MVTYDFTCHECEIIYEGEGKMSAPPKKKKCPQCGKFGLRAWIQAPAVHFAACDYDFETNRSRNEKLLKYGFDKDTAQRFYKESIKNSKAHLETGGQHYSRWLPNLENMEKRGMVKKVSEDESKQKIQNAKEMSRYVHKASKADPEKTSKQGF